MNSNQLPLTIDTTPAGWYPTQAGLRYWDGDTWTDYIAPNPPTVTTATHGGADHVLHFMFTLLTCGLWLPIWILSTIFTRKTYVTTTNY